MSPPSDEGSEEEWRQGPDGSHSAEDAPALVVVIDTSTIVEIKRKVPNDEQWDLFARMLELVEAGRLVFPSQVHKEVSREKHPDTPGTWCGRAARVVQHSDPEELTLVEILPKIAQLVDENAESTNEPADPYVVAMAYELRTGGYDVAVATDDRVDRLPLKIAVTTACDALELATWDCETFIAWVRTTADLTGGSPVDR